MVSTSHTAPRDRALVFFDLDGTITRRDTLFGYVLSYAAQRGFRWLKLPVVLPDVLMFLLGRRDHGALKGALISKLLGGASRADIAAWNQQYIPRLLQTGVFPAALEQIRAHQARGDHLVLMTATVDLYVPELAQTLGFDEWICSQVSWSGDRLAGRLEGPNVRAEEKALRLQAVMARFPGLRVIAYGNSRPDLPHMRLAAERVLINANRALRKAAADIEVDYRDWR